MASLSLVGTIRESIRYRGRSGQYSWMAHRLAGLGILAFLVIHVWETALAFYKPELYMWAIDVFKHPLFGLGEIAIMAAILFHAFNGIRISLLDFKPEWWLHQKRSVNIVWALFLIVFIPIGAYMLFSMASHCGELAAAGETCLRFPLPSDYMAP